MKGLADYLIVFIGGGLGSALRYAVNRISLVHLGEGYWGTLFVNVSGSFAMGLVVGWFAFYSETGNPAMRLFLATGVLGGFTTFSTFSLETALFWQRGQYWEAGLYVAGSVLAGLLGLAGGIALFKS